MDQIWFISSDYIHVCLHHDRFVYASSMWQVKVSYLAFYQHRYFSVGHVIHKDTDQSCFWTYFMQLALNDHLHCIVFYNPCINEEYFKSSWTTSLPEFCFSPQILTPASAWWQVLHRWIRWCLAWASCPLLFLKTYLLWRRSSTARAAPCFPPTPVSLSQLQRPLRSCFTINISQPS